MLIIVENGLPEILAERRIRSASEFARLMAPHLGKTLSTSQITRYMRDPPPAFDLKFIGAACSVLRCVPTDLFKVRIECETGENLEDLGPLPKRVEVVRTASVRSSASGSDAPAQSAEEPLSEARSNVPESIHTGPKVHLFPFHPK